MNIQLDLLLLHRDHFKLLNKLIFKKTYKYMGSMNSPV